MKKLHSRDDVIIASLHINTIDYVFCEKKMKRVEKEKDDDCHRRMMMISFLFFADVPLFAQPMLHENYA